MRYFFDNLESAGFNNAHSVAALVSYADKELVKSKFTKSMPSNYLKVINELTDHSKKEVLLTVAHNINLYIKTKFGDTRIFEDWVTNGVIPSSYHNGLNSRNLSLIAKDIIKFSERINRQEKSKSENKFYFALIDLESSLGGIY